MPKSQTNASRAWNEKNLDRIYVTVPAGEKEEIKAAATAAGESVNGYIKEAIRMRMDAERMGENDA